MTEGIPEGVDVREPTDAEKGELRDLIEEAKGCVIWAGEDPLTAFADITREVILRRYGPCWFEIKNTSLYFVPQAEPLSGDRVRYGIHLL